VLRCFLLYRLCLFVRGGSGALGRRQLTLINDVCAVVRVLTCCAATDRRPRCFNDGSAAVLGWVTRAFQDFDDDGQPRAKATGAGQKQGCWGRLAAAEHAVGK
jgi:hypothetical protein